MNSVIKTPDKHAPQDEGKAAETAKAAKWLAGGQYPLLRKAASNDAIPAVILSALNENPALRESMERACERGRNSMRKRLAEPYMLRLADFADRLALTGNSICRCRQADAMRRNHQAIALQESKYKPYYYPEWQIDPATHLIYPIIAELFKILHSSLAVFAFLTNRDSGFAGKTGLEILRAGDNDRLCRVALAHAYGDFG